MATGIDRCWPLEQGGITAQQFHYAPDLWVLFGVGYLDQDRLTWDEFDAMVAAADNTRD